MTRNTQPAVMAGNSTGWIRVSREQPCPVCNRDHNCNISQDGVWAYCGRIAGGAIRENDGGQFLHKLEDRQPEYEHPSHQQHQNGDKPKPSGKPRGKIVAQYGYVDEAGKLLFEVVRLDPKDFRQRQPGEDGSWIWNLTGVRRVPYRLPQILSRADDMVFVLEGEKDCDAAQGIGLLATTSAQGAKSADKTDWSYLAGRQVVVCPDNDTAGEKYADAVIEQLRALKPQPEIRVLRLPGLPEKADLFDYIESLDSKSPEDIASGILEMALRQPVVGKRLHLLDMTAEPNLAPVVIDGLLREGETGNVIAPAKSGKSWLVYSIVFAVLYGLRWLGHQCEQGDVLLIDNELHGSTLRHRLYQVYCSLHRAGDISDPWDTARGRIHAVSLRGQLMDIDALADAFIAELEAGQYKLVVLDALYRFLPDGMSENDNAGFARIYNRIDAVATRLGVAVIAVHHSSKGNQSGKSVVDTGAGAGSIARAADAHIVIRQHETSGVFVLDSALRSFAPAEPICATFDWPLWRVADGFDPSKLHTANGGKSDSDKDAEVLTVLYRIGKPTNKQSIRAETSMSGEQLNNSLIRLHNSKRIHVLDAKTRHVLDEIPERGRVLFVAVGEPDEQSGGF